MKNVIDAPEDEIKVGDEVEDDSCVKSKVVVTRRFGEYFNGINAEGNVYNMARTKYWHKTGRHFEKAVELLEQMRESE